MAIKSEALEQVEARSEAELWAWLGAHHAQAESVWLVTWLKAHPAAYISRDAVLDALVAHGWIDGIRRKLDADRTMQLIGPRKQQAWAQSYKDRADRLIATGRMRPPGHASISAGQASGLWDFFADVDALIVPPDLRDALGAGEDAWAAQSPSYRRNVLRWIKIAKTAATRAKRIQAAAAATRAGEKLPQM